MVTHWTEMLKDISEVARQSLHNLVIDNTPPLPQCYEREFMEVASDLKKNSILREVLTDQDKIKVTLKTIISSASDSIEEAQKILHDFETDAQKSLSLLEKEFSDISNFMAGIDEKKGEQLDRNMGSFLDAGSEYTKRIGAAMLDIGKFHEKLAQLSKQIDQDHLTGVYNRRAWEHDVVEISSAANREADREKGFTVAMIDIDHFKHINDTHGHPIGDAVLKQFGALIKNHFTATGSVYRYGGDEFAVIMPGMGLREAVRHVELFRTRLEKTVFVAQHGKTRINITTSCGLAEWKPAVKAEDVVGGADRALYEAKEAGRNCVKAV